MALINKTLNIRKGGSSVLYNCDMCGIECIERLSHFKRTKRHYCSNKCYWDARKLKWHPCDQPTWNGGKHPLDSAREWRKRNIEKTRHYKLLYYARKRGAEGSHTISEWESLKELHNNKCAICGASEVEITKDHIIPLSKGGSNYISNIQPLCRSCNSKKRDKIIHDNPELLNPKP